MVISSDSDSDSDLPSIEASLPEITYLTNIVIFALISIGVFGCTFYIVHKAVTKYFLIQGIDTAISWSSERTYCGRAVSCTITYTKKNGEPLTPEDLQDIINNIVVYVEKIGKPIKISVVIEEQDAQSNVFTVTFTVRKAGEYNIYMSYSCFFWEYSCNGSPFVKEFISAEIDPAKTKLDIHNPNFICVQTGIVHQISIDARDFYGNLCNNNDLKLTEFQFVIKDIHTRTNSEGTVEGKFLFIENGTKPSLHLKALDDSVYQASVLYGGHPIKNGSEFYIISLSSSEELQVEKHLMSFSSILKYFFTWESIQFRGILKAIGSEVKDIEDSPCKIKVTITHRYISIEEDFGIIFWRKASYTITKKTEMNFTESIILNGEMMYSVVLSDGIQTPITMLLSPGDARILLVTFAHFQGDQLRNFTSFQEKRKYFQKNLCGTSLFWRHSTRHIKINRSNLVQSMMEEVQDFSYHDWCAIFSVTFLEDTAAKAPFRNLSTDYEWLDLLCDEIFTNNPNGMFSHLGSTNLLHPNLAKARNPKWQEKHYEFAGKILGKFLYESTVAENSSLHVRFTRSLLAQLVGLPVNYQHLVQDHPQECRKVREILNSPDVDKKGFTFTIDDDIPSTPQGILAWVGISRAMKSKNKINVIPDGSNVKVTNENKIFYLNAVAHYELAYKFTNEIAALRNGFCLLVSRELLADLSEQDLDLLLCGGRVFNIKDLKKHHILASCHVTTQRRDVILSWFWSSVTNMNEEERLRLLQLVTGSCVLPAGGFKKLYPQFTIGIKGSFGQKPIGIPSLHEISLADHVSFETFETNLLSVVHGDWRQI